MIMMFGLSFTYLNYLNNLIDWNRIGTSFSAFDFKGAFDGRVRNSMKGCEMYNTTY